MQFIVNLHINTTEFEKYYTGINIVTAESTDGRKVQFPVNILQEYISHNGIHGLFALEYDEQYKFKKIQKLAS